MNEKFIGKRIKNGQWIRANNRIYDEASGSHYLIPDLFTAGEFNFSKHRSIYKYKVHPKSIGVAIGKDDLGNMLYTGDNIKVTFYYIGNATEGKFEKTATVMYDEERKVCCMRANRKTLLFSGDPKHFILSVVRIKRRDE